MFVPVYICWSYVHMTYCSNSDEEYDELDDRYEDQYWMTDNTLYVEDAINFSAKNHSAQKPKVTAPVDTVNRYAVNKLIR